MRQGLWALQLLVGVLALAALVSSAQEKLRVFVTGSSSRAESIDHLNKRCPEVTVTIEREKADYIIVHDHTGAGMGRSPHKITVFNREDDAIYSGATRTVSGALKDACKAIRNDIKSSKQRSGA